MPIKDMQQWDVWELDQLAAREISNPKQPLDKKREARRYVILSVSKNIQTTGVVVCSPIGEHPYIFAYNPLISKGEAGSSKECCLWCHEIYTFSVNLFSKKIGSISHRQEELKVLYKLYLRLDF